MYLYNSVWHVSSCFPGNDNDDSDNDDSDNDVEMKKTKKSDKMELDEFEEKVQEVEENSSTINHHYWMEYIRIFLVLQWKINSKINGLTKEFEFLKMDDNKLLQNTYKFSFQKIKSKWIYLYKFIYWKNLFV